MGMTPEEIKEYNEKSRREFEKFKLVNKNDLFGFVVPFVLYFGGVLTPFVIDDVLVWFFSLVPFYVYLFLMQGFGHTFTSRNVVGVSILTTLFGFVLFVISCVFGELDGSLGISIRMMEINSFISIPIVVVLCFTHRMENCIPWPYYYFMEQTIDDEKDG